jgi:putative ABC transport system permease protein
VLYKACVATAVHFLINASDMKLITATLFLVILVLSMDKKRKVAG